jgi:hypothetical protein
MLPRSWALPSSSSVPGLRRRGVGAWLRTWPVTEIGLGLFTAGLFRYVGQRDVDDERLRRISRVVATHSERMEPEGPLVGRRRVLLLAVRDHDRRVHNEHHHVPEIGAGDARAVATNSAKSRSVMKESRCARRNLCCPRSLSSVHGWASSSAEVPANSAG